MRNLTKISGRNYDLERYRNYRNWKTGFAAFKNDTEIMFRNLCTRILAENRINTKFQRKPYDD